MSVAAPAPKIPGMHDRDRFKLIGVPCRMPRCKVGRLLRCSIRGKVRVRGIHEAPIGWPYTFRLPVAVISRSNS